LTSNRESKPAAGSTWSCSPHRAAWEGNAQEIALGSLRQREVVLDLLANLYQLPTIEHREILHLADRHRLWGRGLNVMDVHLMAAVAVTPGSALWTRDKRLKSACPEARVRLFD